MPGALRPWLIVAALFLVTFGISNPIAAFGVFLPVLEEDLGWSRGAISLALSINFLVGAPTGFLLGALTDRWGPRLILPVTIVLAGTGFMLVATVDALWQLYVAVGLVAGLGTSAFYLLAAATVARDIPCDTAALRKLSSQAPKLPVLRQSRLAAAAVAPGFCTAG